MSPPALNAVCVINLFGRDAIPTRAELVGEANVCLEFDGDSFLSAHLYIGP